MVAGELSTYSFDTLVAQIGHAVDRTGATRLALDSLSAVQTLLDAPGGRQSLRDLLNEVRRMGLTSLFTLEAPEGAVTFGLGEFVVDNVVVLRNRLEDSRRRRSVEVLKMRGARHRKGEYPFTVLPHQGIVMLPLSSLQLTAPSSGTRVTSGNAGLDDLVAGRPVPRFDRPRVGRDGHRQDADRDRVPRRRPRPPRPVAGVRVRGEPGADVPERLRLGARLRRVGGGRPVADRPRLPRGPPRSRTHLVDIKREVDEYRPTRVVIDSLSALERNSDSRGFREFAIGLTSYLKSEAVLTMLTAATPSLFGGDSVTEQHVSTLTDTILLLRYVELQGAVRRGVTVLKMRGSAHDHDIREFTIDGGGMHIGEPFRHLGGILRGDVVDTPGGMTAVTGGNTLAMTSLPRQDRSRQRRSGRHRSPDGAQGCRARSHRRGLGHRPVPPRRPS